MANYTKGKWEEHIVKSRQEQGTNIYSDDSQGVIAHVYNTDQEQGNTDAHLIAAAPDMYEALKKIIGWLNNQAKRDEGQSKACRFLTLRDAYISDAKNYRAMANDINKALVKAEGKSNG